MSFATINTPLTPGLVGRWVDDINRSNGLADRGLGTTHRERAEQDRMELFRAIKAGLQSQYLLRRKLWANIDGTLPREAHPALLEFIIGFCSAMVVLGFPDNLIPTMTAFLASARDPDNALGLDRYGNPKEPSNA